MNHSLLIQVLLIICIIIIVTIGLIALLAYDKQLKRHIAFEPKSEERKKGNAFQSNDIINAASILILFTILRFTMPSIYDYFIGNLREFLGYIGTTETLTVAFAIKIFELIGLGILSVAGPVMLCAMAVGIVASGAQTRFIFALDPLKPKFSRLNPL